MKTIITSLTIIGILVFALSSTTSVSAQSGTTCTLEDGSACGRGGMRGQGGLTNGILHDEMVTLFSQELGLSEEVINDRLTAGETMSEIALSTGLTLDEFFTLMTEVRSDAINLAVENGDLTQEQAQLMQQTGTMRGMGGRVGGRMGNRGSAGTCTRIFNN